MSGKRDQESSWVRNWLILQDVRRTHSTRVKQAWRISKKCCHLFSTGKTLCRHYNDQRRRSPPSGESFESANKRLQCRNKLLTSASQYTSPSTSIRSGTSSEWIARVVAHVIRKMYDSKVCLPHVLQYEKFLQKNWTCKVYSDGAECSRF